MSENQLQQLYLSVFNQTQKLLSPDSFYIAKFDQKNGTITCPYLHAKAAQDSISQSNSIPKEIEKLISSVVNKNVTQYGPEKKMPCTRLVVPLASGNNVYGAVAVEKRVKLLDERQKVLLETIARQTTPYIERILLENQIRRKVKNLKAINEIGSRLNSAIELSEEKILEMIYHQATSLMDTTDMYIALYEPDSKIADEYDEMHPEKSKIYGTVSFGLYVSDGKRITPPESLEGLKPRKAGHGLTEYVIRTKKAYRPEDVANAYVNIATNYIGKIPESWLGVPMISGDNVLGVIVLRNDEAQNFYSQDDEEVLEALANISTVAYINVKYVKDIRDKKDLMISLNHIGTNLVSHTDLDTILKEIVNTVQIKVESDYASIFLFDSEGKNFTKSIRLGDEEENPDLPPSTGFTSDLVKNKLSVFINDRTKMPSVKPTIIQGQNVESFAGIPLVVRAETVGVMYVSFVDHHEFTEDEKLIINLIGKQAAVAIDNARRIDDLKISQSQIADHEQALVATSMAMDMVHSVNNAAGTIIPWIHLSEKLLKAKKPNIEKLRLYLNKIKRDTEIILQKAKEIRDPIKPAEFLNVEDVLESIVSQAEVLMYPRIEFTIYSKGEIPKIYIEEHQLSAALYAIIQNATKAIQNKGAIKVTLSKDTPPDLDTWMVRIDIADNGLGVRESIQAEIFEYGKTFWPEPIPGTGYGLWRANSIIRGASGQITVNSKAGKGTIFTIFLPIIEEV